MALSAAERLEEVTSFDEFKTGVKGLSDAGVTTIPRIFIHPPETLSSLKSPSVSLSIPVIDLSGLNFPDGRAAIVDQIKSAASTWGFFQVTNHGLPEAALDGILDSVKAFHAQPPEARRVHYRRDYENTFLYMTNMDLLRSKAASWNDHIRVQMTPPPPDAAVPEICRREVVEWDARVRKVGEALIKLLLEGLGASGRFPEVVATVDRTFVGICYPYCPQPELTVGLTSHTDPHVITVLHQNHLPGLQVKHGEDWVDINPVPGRLTVNIGDLMQIMSNGEYKSVQHRVQANTSPEPRISALVYFNIMNPEKEAGPLPELVSPEKPPKYRNFKIEQYLEVFFSRQLDTNTALKAFKI